MSVRRPDGDLAVGPSFLGYVDRQAPSPAMADDLPRLPRELSLTPTLLWTSLLSRRILITV